MKTTITFQLEDKSLPALVLEVEFNAWKQQDAYWVDGNHWEPGEPAGVEIESVECVDIDIDEPRWIPRPLLVRKIIGALCWQADPKQIDRLVMEAHCEESQGDPDRERE